MRTIAALVLALAACGGDPNVADDGTLTVQEETTTNNRCQLDANNLETGLCVVLSATSCSVGKSVQCVLGRVGVPADPSTQCPTQHIDQVLCGVRRL